MSLFVTQSANRDRVDAVAASLARLSGRGCFLYEVEQTGATAHGDPLFSIVRYTRAPEMPDIEPSQPIRLFFTEAN